MEAFDAVLVLVVETKILAALRYSVKPRTQVRKEASKRRVFRTQSRQCLDTISLSLLRRKIAAAYAWFHQCTAINALRMSQLRTSQAQFITYIKPHAPLLLDYHHLLP